MTSIRVYSISCICFHFYKKIKSMRSAENKAHHENDTNEIVLSMYDNHLITRTK